MGQRGPQPGSGGRPKKALADKVLEGKPSPARWFILGLAATRIKSGRLP